MGSQVQRLNISIEKHSMTLLAVDGTDVQPLEVSSVALHAGERYGFVLCANQVHKLHLRTKKFKIVAEAPELCDPDFLAKSGFRSTPETCRFEAMLTYKGLLGGEKAQSASKPKTHPVTLDLASPESFDLVRALERPPMLKAEPEASFSLRLGVKDDGKMFLHTTEQSWTMPSSPLLMTKGLRCADD